MGGITVMYPWDGGDTSRACGLGSAKGSYSNPSGVPSGSASIRRSPASTSIAIEAGSMSAAAPAWRRHMTDCLRPDDGALPPVVTWRRGGIGTAWFSKGAGASAKNASAAMTRAAFVARSSGCIAKTVATKFGRCWQASSVSSCRRRSTSSRVFIPRICLRSCSWSSLSKRRRPVNANTVVAAKAHQSRASPRTLCTIVASSASGAR
mmetsp:Transcript_49169/g.151837  ORF Transcript_49169/g.151837 Transcript_49169/m.151837 type:complete len:207 (+) Transcript_49169:40-660(+)